MTNQMGKGWAPSYKKPEEPFFEWDNDTPLEEAIMQALGAASVCWENPGGAGVFISDRAELIAKELMHFILEGYSLSEMPG